MCDQKVGGTMNSSHVAIEREMERIIHAGLDLMQLVVRISIPVHLPQSLPVHIVQHLTMRGRNRQSLANSIPKSTLGCLVNSRVCLDYCQLFDGYCVVGCAQPRTVKL